MVKEYGELKHLKLFKKCHFRTSKGITEIESDELTALNKLGRFGWRVINVVDGVHLMERDVR